MKINTTLTRKKVIMVVDDNQGILDVMKLMLEHAGYIAKVTKNGNDVRDLKSPLPDVIFLDIMLSGTSGIELCKVLKSNKDTQNIPLIMFSANGDIAHITEKCGADGFLGKPFQMKDMLAIVEKFTT
jgi:DNA-binding response OmpR family regulator